MNARPFVFGEFSDPIHTIMAVLCQDESTCGVEGERLSHELECPSAIGCEDTDVILGRSVEKGKYRLAGGGDVFLRQCRTMNTMGLSIRRNRTCDETYEGLSECVFPIN
jgi:hypothetical protein